MPKFLRSRDDEELWTRGQALLDDGSFDEVLTIAEFMERVGDPGSFELSARAHLGLGSPSDALAVLERGIRLAPDAGPLWELLGICYAEDGRLGDAACAYDRALGCESVRRDSVTLNQAALAQKRGSASLALRLIEAVEAPDLLLKKVTIQAAVLLELGDAKAAMDVCLTAPWPDVPSVTQRDTFTDLCVTQTNAMVALGSPPKTIYGHLRRALAAVPDAPALLTRYRQFQNRKSTVARLFSVVADFELDPKSRNELRAIGFLRSGQAIADAPEEAVAFFRELEDDRLLVFAELPDVCELACTADPLKGVTVRSPRIYYESRD